MMQLFNLISLQRCGTHAFCNWLLSQNNTDPLTHIAEDVWIKGKNVLVNSLEFHQDNLGEKYNVLKSIKDIELLIFSYETGELSKYEDRLYNQINELFDNYISTNIMNLRSVMNFGASWYKKYHTIPPHMIPQWRERAEEYIGKTNYFPSLKLKYDDWVKDKNYREKVCNGLLLNTPFTDNGIDDVLDFGGGSSFTGTEVKGSDMLVNERYKEFENDNNFLRLFSPSILQLSERVFG